MPRNKKPKSAKRTKGVAQNTQAAELGSEDASYTFSQAQEQREAEEVRGAERANGRHHCRCPDGNVHPFNEALCIAKGHDGYCPIDFIYFKWGFGCNIHGYKGEKLLKDKNVPDRAERTRFYQGLGAIDPKEQALPILIRMLRDPVELYEEWVEGQGLGSAQQDAGIENSLDGHFTGKREPRKGSGPKTPATSRTDLAYLAGRAARDANRPLTPDPNRDAVAERREELSARSTPTPMIAGQRPKGVKGMWSGQQKRVCDAATPSWFKTRTKSNE